MKGKFIESADKKLPKAIVGTEYKCHKLIRFQKKRDAGILNCPAWSIQRKYRSNLNFETDSRPFYELSS